MRFIYKSWFIIFCCLAYCAQIIAQVNLGTNTKEEQVNPIDVHYSYEYYSNETRNASFSLSALASPVTAPYSESFDNASIPTCWTLSGPQPWEFSTSAGFGASGAGDATGNGGNYAWVDGSGSPNNTNITLISPFINVSALTAPTISFKLFSNNVDDGALNLFKVDVWDGTAWNNMFSNQSNLGTDWVEMSLDLSSLTITNDIQVRFVVDKDNSNGQPSRNDILLDDVEVKEAPSCFDPVASFSVVEDCTNGFSVDVNITNLGDAATIDILNGATVLASGVGLGTTTVGPFPNGNSVDVTVQHGSDLTCGITGFGLLDSGNCPAVISCGTIVNRTYCYDSNDNTSFAYSSDNGSPLTITFNAGGIESGWDEIFIRDGANASAPILYQGDNGGNLTGITATSTGTSLFFQIVSDGSVSCVSGGVSPEMDWDVTCNIVCDPPTGTATYDCATNEVTFNVSSIGDGTYNATLDGTGSSQPINTTGTYPPFGSLTPDQTYNIVFDDGMGCSSNISYAYGGCRTLGNNCTSLISNGGFENTSQWDETATDGNNINALFNPIINPELPLAGINSAVFGGLGGSGLGTGEPYTTTLTRNNGVLLANGNTVTLYFWLLADACTSGDQFTIAVDGNVEFSINGTSSQCSEDKWREYAIDLSAYADGTSHTLVFELVENSSISPTRIYIDDLLLESCAPIVCPAQYNGLFGSPADQTDYETDGLIFSIQTIAAGTTIDYDAGTEITLGFVGSTFEVQLGATFCAFIDGCNGTGGAVNPLGETNEDSAALKTSDTEVTETLKDENVENFNSDKKE